MSHKSNIQKIPITFVSCKLSVNHTALFCFLEWLFQKGIILYSKCEKKEEKLVKNFSYTIKFSYAKPCTVLSNKTSYIAIFYKNKMKLQNISLGFTSFAE